MSFAKSHPFCSGISMLQVVSISLTTSHLNASPPEQNGRHFAYDIFKCIFMNEKFCISIQTSLKFVPKDSIDNKSTLV